MKSENIGILLDIKIEQGGGCRVGAVFVQGGGAECMMMVPGVGVP